MREDNNANKYENSETYLQQFCMNFFCKLHKTAASSELIGERVSYVYLHVVLHRTKMGQ
jgi:hypothetical protein